MKESQLQSAVCTILLTGLLWQDGAGKAPANSVEIFNQSSPPARDGDGNQRSYNSTASEYPIVQVWNGIKYSDPSSSFFHVPRDLSDIAKKKVSSSVGRHHVQKHPAPKLTNITNSADLRYFSSAHSNPGKNDGIASETEEKYVSSSNNTGGKYPVSANRTKQGIMERLYADCWKIWKRFVSDFQKIRDICPRFAQTFNAIFNTICTGGREISSKNSSSLKNGHLRRHVSARNIELEELKRKRYVRRYIEHLDSELSQECLMFLKRVASEEGLHSKYILPDIAMKINSAANSSSLFKTPNETRRKRSSSSEGTNPRLESGPSPHDDLNTDSASQERKRRFFSSNVNQSVIYRGSSRSAHDAENYQAHNNYEIYPHLYPYSDTEGIQFLQAQDPEVHVKHPDPVYIYEDATVKPGQYVEVYPGAYQPTYTYSKFPRSYWLFHLLKGLFTIWEALQTLAILYLLWKVAVLTVLPRELGPSFTSGLEYFLHYLGIPTTLRGWQANKGAKDAENGDVRGKNPHQIQYGPITNDAFSKNWRNATGNSTADVPAVRSEADLMEISGNVTKGTHPILNKNKMTTKIQVPREKEVAIIGNEIANTSSALQKKSTGKKGSKEDQKSTQTINVFPQKHADLQGLVKHLRSHWEEHFGCVGCVGAENTSGLPALLPRPPAEAIPAPSLLDTSS